MKNLFLFIMIFLNINLFAAEVSEGTEPKTEPPFATEQDLIEMGKKAKESITPLMEAAKEGNLEALSNELKKADLDLNAQDLHGRTALYYAAMANKPAIINELLKFYPGYNVVADLPDKDGFTPLMQAIELGNLDAVIALMDANKQHNCINYVKNNFTPLKQCSSLSTSNNKSGMTPLMLAVRSGQKEIVGLLLENGADPEFKVLDKKSGKYLTAFDFAANHEIAKILRSIIFINSKLSFNKDSRDKLIKEGIDLKTSNDRGLTPLHRAVLLEDPETVKLFLDAGAEINRGDIYGFSPLHYAVQLRLTSNNIADMLLAAGADIEKIGDYKTPLQFAVIEGGNKDSVHSLLKAGANVNVKLFEDTLLDLAEQRIDLFQKKAGGEIWADDAIKNTNEVIKLLKSYGAE